MPEGGKTSYGAATPQEEKLMKKVIMVLAPGFEELEAVAVADLLRRIGVELTLAGLGGREITGAHKMTLTADVELSMDMGGFDAVVLPGGMPGAANLLASDAVEKLLRDTAKSGGITAAICAAPMVLSRAGLLTGKRFTIYPGFETRLNPGEHPTGAMAERDGNVVTGKGPGAVFAFGGEVAAALELEREFAEIREGMFF